MRLSSRRAIMTAVAVAAFAAVAVIGLVLGRWPGAVSRLLPDDSSRIEQVSCVLNTPRRATLRNALLVTNIVNALPTRCKVTILTNDRSFLKVVSNPDPERVSFVDLPPEASCSIWPQDPFLILQNPDGSHCLLSSRTFERADDRLVPDRLAAYLGWDHRKSRFAFEGGNIVCGRRHVFIGAGTVRINATTMNLTEAEVVRGLQRELGRPVLVVGSLPQTAAHIDMILTPLDERRLVLADAGWGARLARRELDRDPQSVERFERSCEEYYFGDPSIHEIKDPAGRVLRPPQVVGQAAHAVEDSEAIAPSLQAIAAQLSQSGYEVRRVPYLFRLPPELRRTSVDASGPARSPEGEDFQPDYPCLTYNNVLIETEGGAPTVYLPLYGWPAMDSAAVEAWQKLGCRVVPVEGFAVCSMYGGSLRCCVKVLSRR